METETRSQKRLRTSNTLISGSEPGEMSHMTQQQIEAMNRALRNPLIIQEIIKYTEFGQLKIYRQINSQWKLLSNEVIINNSCVRLGWNEIEERFPKASDPNLTLRQLNDVLDRSQNFPTSYFILSNVRRFGDVLSLFHSHGSKVKQLRLACSTLVPDPDSRNDNQTKFHLLLDQLLPNLEDLIINFKDSFCGQWATRFKFSLPSLKSFGYYDADETARKIIQGSPNLESFTTTVATAFELAMITQENKIHTVRSLYIVYDFANSKTLARFVGVRAHLRQLSFPFIHNSKLVPAFNAVLDTHKDTLERIELEGICSYPNIKIPILKKLVRLEIGNSSGRQCLPIGVNLSEIFPNLQVLNSSNMICLVDDSLPLYFPQSAPVFGTFPSVDTLIIGSEVTQLWMEKLEDLCPNFKKLKLEYLLGRPEMFGKIFHRWSQVESLVLGMGDISQYFGSLDPIFTGFSTRVCNCLGTTEVTLGKRVKGYEQLQVRPAIYDLTNLKTLKILLPLSREDVHNRDIPISHLSGLYGFSRLPGLKVTIKVYADEDDRTAATNLVKDKLGVYVDVEFRSQKLPRYTIDWIQTPTTQIINVRR